MSRTPGRYGTERSQRADLWLPARPGPAPLPVVVLVHGGFWRVQHTKVLMRGLARAVAGEGWAALNVEYRRVGTGGGWPRTFFDVVSAIDRLADLADAGAPLDLDRVLTCGHSAGGLLALWAAARERIPLDASPSVPAVRVAAAISLAGVVDPSEASALELGGGAIESLLDGPPESLPRRYELANPLSWVPLGVPQVLIHGSADHVVPLAMSERYAQRARAAGDPVVLEVIPGAGHRELLRRRGPAWPVIRRHINSLTAAET